MAVSEAVLEEVSVISEICPDDESENAARARGAPLPDGVGDAESAGRVGQLVTKCPLRPQYLHSPSLSLRSRSEVSNFPSDPSFSAFGFGAGLEDLLEEGVAEELPEGAAFGLEPELELEPELLEGF